MRIFLFDTETDGLIRNSLVREEKQPRIIELFGLVLDGDLNEVDKWESLFSHAARLSDEIIRITGITNDMLDDAPLFSQKADELKAFIEGCDCVVGHNLTYDMDMVNNEMRRLNLAVNWPVDRICTVEQTEHIKGFRLSLTNLHTHLFGEGFPNAHRAETDVRAMARCFIELRKRGEV